MSMLSSKLLNQAVIEQGIDDPAEHLRLFGQIVREQLSVRETEDRSRVVKKRSPGRETKPSTAANDGFSRIASHVGQQLGTEVFIKSDTKGKGQLSIRFKNEADLQRVLSILDLLP